VCRYFTNQNVTDTPAAYLVAADECNNDATNYWIFTPAGLLRLFHRTGWKVLATQHVGDLQASNPRDNSADERVFAVLERV
jgi:hypothetical protein